MPALRKINIIVLRFLLITALVYLAIALTLIYWPMPQKRDIKNYDFSVLKTGIQHQSLGEEHWLSLRDGYRLFYRYYPSSPSSPSGSKTLLILLHGSGSESRYLSDFAQYLSKNHIAQVITPDLRGHGRSALDQKNIQAGAHQGDIDHLGQYDEDLSDLLTYVQRTQPRVKIILGGHSSGGGLVLRYAANSGGKGIAGYLLMAPYLGHEAITVKPSSGDWVTVAIKRWIGLSMLNNLGIPVLNGLPVLQFNLPTKWQDPLQTKSYSYRLAMSFQPNNYLDDIKKLNRPTLVLVGEKDEGFYADKFPQAFALAEKYAQVSIIPGAKHLDIFTRPEARQIIEHWFNQHY